MDAITNNDYDSTTRRKYNFATIVSQVDVGTPTEPITLVEAKAHLRVDFTDDDTYLTDTIKECRLLFERITGVGIVSKTVTAEVRNDSGNVVLPYWPVTSITSATDEYGTVFTNYDFYHNAYLRTPSTTKSIIVYVTTALSPVPADIKRAIKLMVAFCYRHRGDDVISTKEYDTVLHTICSSFKRSTWLL